MKKIVIKIGTSTLTQGTQQLSRRSMLGLVQQIAELHNRGIQLFVVSSGAVATGKELLHMVTLDSSLGSKQMFAAIGQIQLIRVWSELFSLFDVQIGQVLLTKEDFTDQKKQLTQGMLDNLLEHRIIPIINENDAVASKELGVGDNDTLAVLVAMVVKADTVILLTDQEGLYTANPCHDAEAQLIPIVEKIDERILAAAEGSSTSLGTGGMMTKIAAARLAAASGIRTIIASSARPHVLLELAQGKRIGTLFLEQGK